MMRPSESEIERDALLGSLAVAEGLITQSELDQLLRFQNEESGIGRSVLIADLLLEKGFVGAPKLRALRRQSERFEIGGYRLGDKLGRGGMGSVYRAVSIETGEEAAVKLLTRKRARDRKFVQRFLEEARMLGKLDHPNIVRAMGCGCEQGFYWLAMEFVEGETLIDRIERHRWLPEREVLEMARGVALGLEAAWKERLIHRDIKPENLLIKPDGTVKISDFGLAKDRQGSLKTTIGITFGTPHYMSPEQVRGSQDLDTRSDIYSLGASMYHALTGEFPFDGDTDMDVMVKHLDERPPPIRGLNPTVTRGTIALVESMMAIERTERPQGPTALVAEIERILSGRGPGLVGSMGRSITTVRRRLRDRLARAPGLKEHPSVRRVLFCVAIISMLAFLADLVYLLFWRQ